MQDKLKQNLIETCIFMQKQTMEEAEKLSVEIQLQINDYGQNKDRYDSFRTKMSRMKEMYIKQMENAAINIKTLLKISVNEENTVKYGSIVITDKQRFFVAVGIGKIRFQNEDYFVISTVAPIFNTMKEKRVRDIFTFNNVTHTIQQIL